MNTWIAYVRYRKYSRDLANRVFKRLDNRGLSAAWTQWQAFVFIDKIQNEHGNEVAKLKQQIMEQDREKKKILCNRVFQRIVNRQLVCAWEEWRHHVKIQNLLHRISARFRSHGKSRTMNTWIAYVRYRKYSRDLANRVFKRLDNRGLSAAWTQWIAFLNFSIHTSSIAKIQKQNESNIEAWRKETSSKHLFLKKMVSRRVSIVKVFTRWRVYTVKEKDLRLVQAMNVLRSALHNSHEELKDYEGAVPPAFAG